MVVTGYRTSERDHGGVGWVGNRVKVRYKCLDSVQKQAGGLDRSDTALILRSHQCQTGVEQSDCQPGHSDVSCNGRFLARPGATRTVSYPKSAKIHARFLNVTVS